MGVLGIYGLYTLLRVFKVLPVNTSIRVTRYAYVVLHELSHLIIGLIQGCGVTDLVLKPTGDSAGMYITKYESRLKLGPIKFGMAIMALAGPVLPPLLLYVVLTWMVQGQYVNIAILLLVGFLLIVRYSSQRWYYLVFALALYALSYGVYIVNTDILNYIIVGFVVWCMIGMLDEMLVVGGYNQKGSDMGTFTKNLLGFDLSIVSYLLNVILRLYYIFMLYHYYLILI